MNETTSLSLHLLRDLQARGQTEQPPVSPKDKSAGPDTTQLTEVIQMDVCFLSLAVTE